MLSPSAAAVLPWLLLLLLPWLLSAAAAVLPMPWLRLLPSPTSAAAAREAQTVSRRLASPCSCSFGALLPPVGGTVGKEAAVDGPEEEEGE